MLKLMSKTKSGLIAINYSVFAYQRFESVRYKFLNSYKENGVLFFDVPIGLDEVYILI